MAGLCLRKCHSQYRLLGNDYDWVNALRATTIRKRRSRMHDVVSLFE